MLFVLVATYVGVLAWLTLRQQARFGTFGFDMGIHDQGIWLLSRFERPFVTVRGLHYLGHHLNLVSLLFVPAYWLGAGPSFLYAVETVFLGAGAVPVYLLSRDALGGRWVALVPAAAYLLHPTISWINWWHFHPEALAIAPLLLALWLAGRRRWLPFAACIAFVLTTKEDLALAVAALGVVLAVGGARHPDRRSRPGALTAVVGLAWYLVATQVVMPWFNGGHQPFYVAELFGRWGDSTGSVIVAMVRHPMQVWHVATDVDRLKYYGRLVAPSGFVAVLGLPLLAVAGPQVAANALSSLSTTYDARYHYSVVPVTAVVAATVSGLGALRRVGRVALVIGLAVVMVASLASHHAWAPTPLGRPYDDGYWVEARPRQAAYERAVAAVPAGASVAATYFLVPHLTHRRLVYEWPNPWIVGNWGFANRDPDDPAAVDYVVVDAWEGQQPALLDGLTSSGEFTTVLDQDGVVVLRRLAR